MATYTPAKRATAYRFNVALVSQANTKLMQVNPTLAAGDVKVSKDNGAFANLTTLPSVAPAGGTQVQVDLSATEMTADNVFVQFTDVAGAEWCDLAVNIATAARQIDDLAFPATSGRSMVVDAAGLVDANMVKAGASGAGNTITTSGGVTLPAATIASTTNITAATGVDITKILGTAISTPATAGILDVNVKNMNNVAGTPITTIKAVQGLTTADTIITVSGNVNGSVASVAGNVAGSVASVTGNVGGNVTGSVGSVVGAVGSVTGAVGSVTGNVGGNVTGSIGTITNTGIDGILDRSAGVETNFTLRQAMRLMLSSVVAKLSGAATATVVIRDINDTKNRITATCDASGNRTAVTTDVT